MKPLIVILAWIFSIAVLGQLIFKDSGPDIWMYLSLTSGFIMVITDSIPRSIERFMNS